MPITINGEPHSLTLPCSLAALVDQLQLNLQQIAIERNSAIVPRSTYATTMLAEGDRLEIVRFIGGG